MDLQKRVINTQVLPKVILGNSTGNIADLGRGFSADMFSVFYRYDADVCLSGGRSNKECNQTKQDVENVINKIREKRKSFLLVNESVYVL